MHRSANQRTKLAERIHHESPEQLLLEAVLHPRQTHTLIEAELDRRSKGELPRIGKITRRDDDSEYSKAA